MTSLGTKLVGQWEVRMNSFGRVEPLADAAAAPSATDSSRPKVCAHGLEPKDRSATKGDVEGRG